MYIIHEEVMYNTNDTASSPATVSMAPYPKQCCSVKGGVTGVIDGTQLTASLHLVRHCHVHDTADRLRHTCSTLSGTFMMPVCLQNL